MEPTLRIGEVARRAGVNVQTLRYYERRGILAAPSRSRAGYRQYPVETVAVVRAIKRAQRLGFSLDEIVELLRIKDHPRGGCRRARELACERLAVLDASIDELERARARLAGLISDCAPAKRAEECPLISAIAPEETAAD